MHVLVIILIYTGSSIYVAIKLDLETNTGRHVVNDIGEYYLL